MRYTNIHRVLALMAILLSLLAMGCDDAVTPSEPDFTTANWMDGHPIIILMSDLGDYNGSWLITEVHPGEVSASFNEVNATIGDTEFRTEEDRWFTEINHSGLIEGATIPYRIVINGTEYTGSVRVPNRPVGVFPFYTSGDYSFEWTTSREPDIYLSRLRYTYQSYFGEVYETLPGSSLEHTILSSSWGGTVIYPLDLRLTALNYQQNTGGVFIVCPMSTMHYFGTVAGK